MARHESSSLIPPRFIAVLGSTGSIGQSTLDIVRRFSDSFRVDLLVAGTRVEQLAKDIAEFKPARAVVATEEALSALQEALGISKGTFRWNDTELAAGSDAVCSAVRESDAAVVVAAVVGMAGLPGVLAAAEAGKIIALANKESLVVAGSLVIETARRCGATIVPVDSEHSAIFQCLMGVSEERRADVASVILTSSGGPFRTKPITEFASITVEQALKHPKWSMGAKITIDSSTMMNKALEVIEAHWLFSMPPNRIEVVVHPEHIIHSFVRFVDGAILGQLGLPDMRGPISLAINYPHGRLEGAIPQLDLCSMGALHFEPVDDAKFPSVKRAYEVLKAGGAMPAVFNAANEVAVESFLAKTTPYLGIHSVVGAAVEHFSGASYESLEEVEALCAEVTAWSRQYAGIGPK
jgi:1-deoxy-D-xylulose-5-phosphate reductoisomerase